MEAAAQTAEKAGGPDWDTIHGLMEDAIYGGRIDNPYDLRVLRTYLHRFGHAAEVYDRCEAGL